MKTIRAKTVLRADGRFVGLYQSRVGFPFQKVTRPGTTLVETFETHKEALAAAKAAL